MMVMMVMMVMIVNDDDDDDKDWSYSIPVQDKTRHLSLDSFSLHLNWIDYLNSEHYCWMYSLSTAHEQGYRVVQIDYCHRRY